MLKVVYDARTMTTLSQWNTKTEPIHIHDQSLVSIAERVINGQRLNAEDGLTLYETTDLWTVCSLANVVREKLHGNIAYYNINRHLNYSNVCALSCKFCDFHRKKDQEGAYEHSLDDIKNEVMIAKESGATEIHIVGGLHPWLPFSYYTDMLELIKEMAPEIHIKAFTAVEIVSPCKDFKTWQRRKSRDYLSIRRIKSKWTWFTTRWWC